MAKDEIFKNKGVIERDFSFNGEVAEVFDDMLRRSVPFYEEVQRMIGEIASDFAKSGTNLYDLGCSTGNTLVLLDGLLPKDMEFIGIDYSKDMLKKQRKSSNPMECPEATKLCLWILTQKNLYP